MNLYEITRALVARGCPEHPRLLFSNSEVNGGPRTLWMLEQVFHHNMDEADARAIWVMWALEWYCHGIPMEPGQAVVIGGVPDLEAIEAATRHLEPTNA